MPDPVAYIDADILLHRSCSFCEDEFDGDPIGDSKQAVWFFNYILRKWLGELKRYADYFLVISQGKNHRHRLFPEYKGNRKDIVPHPAFAKLKAEVESWLETECEPGIEADDLIGIRVTEAPNRVAVSADKDFLTIPCRLMVPTSHGRTKPDWYEISEQEANVQWLRQALTGDVVDNYKGLPKCGPVGAAKIVLDDGTVEENWARLVQAFEAKGFTEDYALNMARLARILRAGEYNFETKEVSLWEPVFKT